MLPYDKMYMKLGVRRVAHFIKPIIVDTNTFTFPFKSMLYWYVVSDIIVPLTKKYSYFNNIDKVYVKTILEYNDDSTVGSYKNTHILPNTIVTKLTMEEKEFKFIKPSVKDVPMTDKSLFVLNYGALGAVYSYNPNPLMRYFKWHNTYEKVVSQLQQKNYETMRNRFVVYTLPTTLLTRQELDKYAAKIISTNLERLPTYEYFNLIDIWRYLTPELKSDSLLSKIPDNELSNITLMLMCNTKMVLLNLNVLAGIVEEYGLQTKLRKYKAATVRKMLYIMLYSLINNKAIEYNTILQMPDTAENDIIIKPESIGDTSNSLHSEQELDLNDILSKHVIEKDAEDTIPVIETDDGEIVNEITEDELKSVTDVDVKKYENKQMLLEETVDRPKVLEEKVSKLASFKIISKNEQDRMLHILESQQTALSPLPHDSRPLSEILDPKKDDYVIPNELVDITDNIVIADPNLNKDVIGAINKKYMEEQYDKDLIRTVYGLQLHNAIVEDYKITEDRNILGATQTHSVKVKTLNGKASTLSFILPKIETDGTFMLSNNRYRLRWQRSDLPIRKIDNTTVYLSSYYGKVSVSKANIKKDDVGYWIRNKLIKMYDTDDRLKDLVLIPMDNVDVKLPLSYSYFARYVKSFRFKNISYCFDYDKRASILDIDKNIISSAEKKQYVVVGKHAGHPVVIDTKNVFYVYRNNQYVEIPSLLEELELDLEEAPIEHTVIKLYNKAIPCVVFLGYYLGLYNLMNTLKVSYHFETTTRKITTPPNEYAIKFKDGTLYIKRDYGDADLILGGLIAIKNILKETEITVLLNKSKYKVLFSKLELSLLYTNEFDLINNMFVDPITETMLMRLKEPTTFKGLLIRANEILVDDSYMHPNDVLGMCYKGYERIAGMVYKELVMASREHENRSYFSKSKITLNPYKMLSKINEDSTTVLIDDLNPIAYLKQSEDTTYLGYDGRSKESMARDTRSSHISERGIVSEAGKDSGDVGITAYLSAVPKIKSIRGDVGTFDFNIPEDGWGSVLSTSALIAPFATNDDVKRLGFSSIQNSHVIPMNNMSAPYVRTGYDAIIPIRVGGKFVIIAEESGVVTSVTKNSITVTYPPSKNSRVKVRTATYELSSWTSKEESGTCYTHNMKANLAVGDTFIKDDTIAYDTSFFEPDFFNPKRVIYKQGEVINVALMEDLQTFEDSGAVSKEMSEYLATSVTKIKSIVVGNTDNIVDAVSVGDKIEPSSSLFSIVDSIAGDFGKLDERTRQILQDLKMSSPKAKMRGIITKIVIYYNCEFDTLSDSLKELVKTSDALLIKQTGFSGRVNSSYSINGRPLLQNEVEIKTYIKVNDIMGIGDKAIFGNQLKFTVGEVFEQEVIGTEGTKVDAFFSTVSIKARIVNSPDLIGTTTTLLEAIKKKAREIYNN